MHCVEKFLVYNQVLLVTVHQKELVSTYWWLEKEVEMVLAVNGNC